MRLKSGPKIKKEKYELILSFRRKRKPITEIGAILGVSKQAISYYLRRYGDVDKSGVDK